MKAHKIELKIVPFVLLASGQELPGGFDYRDGIKSAMASGGERGMSGEDVVKAADLIPELKTANGALYLSPEDHAWLVRRVNGVVWREASEAIASFIKDIREAPLVEIESQERPN